MAEENKAPSRRHFLRDGLWGTCIGGLGVTVGLSTRGQHEEKVLADRSSQVYPVRQVRQPLRVGRVRGQVRAVLCHVRLL